MDFSELKELIRILEQSGLSELEVEENGRRIRLQKASVVTVAAPIVAHPAPVALVAPAAQPAAAVAPVA